MGEWPWDNNLGMGHKGPETFNLEMGHKGQETFFPHAGLGSADYVACGSYSSGCSGVLPQVAWEHSLGCH